jgi:hypothetical protein
MKPGKLQATFLPLMLCFTLCAPVFAQAPTGSINGTVADQTGAVIPNASVTVTNKADANVRTLTTNADGLYSAPALPSGDYEVRAEVSGFKTLIRQAQVAAGGTTSVDMAMTLGQANDVVNVEETAAQINYESHTVAGVIARQTIQELPINGRSFLSLATLEPGVTTTPGVPAQFNSLVNITTLGGGGYTRLTIDGGIVNDEWEGTGATSMNFSQEVVSEFQLSTVNFDVTAGIGTGGQLNIVTRSGGNDYHGSGYFLFRDHNMAAYPGLKRPTDPSNPSQFCVVPTSSACSSVQNPYFGRRNPGFWVGGPIMRNKLFFFANYEYMNQKQVYVLQEDLNSLRGLSGTPISPYHNTLFSSRFDYTLSSKHTIFARYSHDGNVGFGPYGGTVPLQSSWSNNDNWSDQSIVGLTSVLTTNIVNDARFQYHYWRSLVEIAGASQCAAPCPGLGLPSLVVPNAQGALYGGVSDNSPQPRQGRVYELVDNVSWQKGAHRIRFGADYERIVTKNTWTFCQLGCLGVYAPENVISGANPAVLAASGYVPPSNVSTSADLLSLPVFNTSSSIYSGIDVGDGRFPGPYDRTAFNHNDRPKFYGADTWKINSNLTVNAALGWEFETGLWYNLPFPQYLAPIVGANNLAAPKTNYKQFAPQLGFAYALGKDKKTVIRGGAGMFWDSEPLWHHFRAGASLGPVGNGRTTLTAGSLTNIYPGIVNLATGAPLKVGDPLPLNTLTNMTLQQFVNIYNQQLPVLNQQLAPTPPSSGSFSVSGIDVAKTAVELHTPDFKIMRSYQTSLGVQRDMGHDMILQVDWARRQFENVDLGELDLNRSAQFIGGQPAPVIPTCTAAQKFVPGQECSTGSITFWVPQGRTVYNGLLVKLQKRLSHRYSFTASYALQSQLTVVAPTLNLDNYFSTYGQNLNRQTFNVAGLGSLRYGFKLSINNSMLTRLPVEPTISGYDLNGAGSTTLPITLAVPGQQYNCFNITCSNSDLQKLVSTFNSTLAGTKDARGTAIKSIAIPSNYELGAPKLDTDVRLTKEFVFKEKYRAEAFVEGFNIFNIANLTGYSFAITPGTASPSFGQPTSRVGQVFGSGGPRAFEVGARVSF